MAIYRDFVNILTNEIPSNRSTRVATLQIIWILL